MSVSVCECVFVCEREERKKNDRRTISHRHHQQLELLDSTRPRTHPPRQYQDYIELSREQLLAAMIRHCTVYVILLNARRKGTGKTRNLGEKFKNGPTDDEVFTVEPQSNDMTVPLAALAAQFQHPL